MNIGDYCVINPFFDEDEVALYGYSRVGIKTLKDRCNKTFQIVEVLEKQKGIAYSLRDIVSGDYFEYFVYEFLLLKKPSIVISGLFDIVTKGE